jgi:hypothetical protein
VHVRFVVNNKDSTHIGYAFFNYWLVAWRGKVSVKRTVSKVFNVGSRRPECGRDFMRDGQTQTRAR